MGCSGGTNENRGLWSKEIIWYRVYGGSVDGTSAIEYSIFVLRLWKGTGGIESLPLNGLCGLSIRMYRLARNSSKMRNIDHF